MTERTEWKRIWALNITVLDSLESPLIPSEPTSKEDGGAKSTAYPVYMSGAAASTSSAPVAAGERTQREALYVQGVLRKWRSTRNYCAVRNCTSGALELLQYTSKSPFISFA